MYNNYNIWHNILIYRRKLISTKVSTSVGCACVCVTSGKDRCLDTFWYTENKSSL